MPESWERVRAEKRAKLEPLVADGTLAGQGTGVQLGSFYDWLGERVLVRPQWARAFEVRPDCQADEVLRHRAGRERAREAYQGGPRTPVVHLPGFDAGEPSKVDEVVDHQKERLRSEVDEAWRLLLSVEAVVAEAARALGEDPALPEVRQALDGSRERLEEMHGEAQRYAGPFELDEPGEGEVDLVRRVARLPEV